MFQGIPGGGTGSSGLRVGLRDPGGFPCWTIPWFCASLNPAAAIWTCTELSSHTAFPALSLQQTLLNQKLWATQNWLIITSSRIYLLGFNPLTRVLDGKGETIREKNTVNLILLGTVSGWLQGGWLRPWADVCYLAEADFSFLQVIKEEFLGWERWSEREQLPGQSSAGLFASAPELAHLNCLKNPKLSENGF